MGIKTVPQPPYSSDLGPCDFWLFPKLRGGRYERIEEMKEGVTKVIDTLTQEDFHGVFQKLLERYSKCISAGGDYFKGYLSLMCVLSIKVPIWKKSGNLSYAPRILTTHNHLPCRWGIEYNNCTPSILKEMSCVWLHLMMNLQLRIIGLGEVTILLPLFPGTLSPGVVVPFRISSMG